MNKIGVALPPDRIGIVLRWGAPADCEPLLNPVEVFIEQKPFFSKQRSSSWGVLQTVHLEDSSINDQTGVSRSDETGAVPRKDDRRKNSHWHMCERQGQISSIRLTQVSSPCLSRQQIKDNFRITNSPVDY